METLKNLESILKIFESVERLYTKYRPLRFFIRLLRSAWGIYSFLSLIVLIFDLLISFDGIYEIISKYTIIKPASDIARDYGLAISMIILTSYAIGYLYKIWRISKTNGLSISLCG